MHRIKTKELDILTNNKSRLKMYHFTAKMDRMYNYIYNDQ